LATEFKDSFDRCPVKFTKYMFKAASFLEDGDREFEKRFQLMLPSNLNAIGIKAAPFELEGDDFQFLDLLREFLVGRSVTLKNLLSNAILEVKPRSADRFASGVLSIFSSVCVDDSVVSISENRQMINAFVVKNKAPKSRDWFVYPDLSRAIPGPDQIGRKSHDFSDLTSDTRVSERLCLLFDQAVKSRESVSHYLTVRAVGQCLKNQAFFEFARPMIHVDALVAFLGRFSGLDDLMEQWKLYCRCKKLDSSEGQSFDWITTADRHFYVSQNLRNGAVANISIQAPKPVAIELGFVEESGGDELFDVIESRTFESVTSLSMSIDGAISFSARVGDTSIPISDTRRLSIFIASESQLQIDISTAAKIFQTPNPFVDRFASGRFGLSLPRHFLNCRSQF
jgi:hypothetical protein